MSSIGRRLLITLLMLAGLLGFSASGASAVEQGTITVFKTWAGQAPSEVVQVCFAVSDDAAGANILGTACTSDETYTVVFGPTEPPLQTGVTYYVWEITSDTGEILQGPVEAVIPDTTGNVDVTFENPSAAPAGAIEVHVSACPAGVQPGTLFESCHANGIAGDEILLDGPVSLSGVTSGDIGAVRFDGLPAGTYTIAEAVMTGDFASYEVYCSTDGGATQVPIEYRGNGRAAVQLDLGQDQEVICDWYNIPAEPQPPQQITFRISKYTCPTDPGNVSVAAGNIPPECAPTAGVAFSVAAQDGTQIGTCTTDGTGVCSLQVPNEATVTVTEDTTTAPAGYAPRQNPITTQAITEFAGALFINLPVGAPQPTVAPTAAPTVAPTATPPTGGVITLPKTGSGPASGPDLPWTPLLATGVVLALAAAALGHAGHRRDHRA